MTKVNTDWFYVASSAALAATAMDFFPMRHSLQSQQHSGMVALIAAVVVVIGAQISNQLSRIPFYMTLSAASLAAGGAYVASRRYASQAQRFLGIFTFTSLGVLITAACPHANVDGYGKLYAQSYGDSAASRGGDGGEKASTESWKIKQKGIEYPGYGILVDKFGNTYEQVIPLLH